MHIINHLIHHKEAYISLCRHYFSHDYEDAYHDLIVYWYSWTGDALTLITTPADIMKHSEQFIISALKKHRHRMNTEVSVSRMTPYEQRSDSTDATQRYTFKLLDAIDKNKRRLTPAQKYLLDMLAQHNYCCWRVSQCTGLSKSTLYRKFNTIINVLKKGTDV